MASEESGLTHGHSAWPTSTDGKKRGKKRIRNITPADRAAHKVSEKSRKGAFNDQLMELAHLIPTISADRKPTKQTVINESIAYHRAQNRQCLDALQAIESLMTERDELLQELNSLRGLLQPGTSTNRTPRPLANEVYEFMKHKDRFRELGRETTADDSSTDVVEVQIGNEDLNSVESRQQPLHEQTVLDIFTTQDLEDLDFLDNPMPENIAPLDDPNHLKAFNQYMQLSRPKVAPIMQRQSLPSPDATNMVFGCNMFQDSSDYLALTPTYELENTPLGHSVLPNFAY